MPTVDHPRNIVGTLCLPSGKKIAHYEILEPIGKGGMGEVYRARDTKLGRDVAIKVLPEEFANDTDRVARFEREAKLLASLNHPNIASIYGIEESGGTKAILLELVEGPTLGDRIADGPIPVEEALEIGRQIAESLEAAHEAGVIHRDLKPENVKVKEDGTVKVLDYGLAKAIGGDALLSDGADLSRSPTLTRHETRVGKILGTSAYMSPEQATGKRVDRRADIWAFGAVVFEMLTGKRVASGDGDTETLASVIKDDPDWSSLPGDCPEPVGKLLRRCLTKDSKLRLRDIGEARIVLTGTPPAPESSASASISAFEGGRFSSRSWRILPWAVAAAAWVAAVAVWNLRPVAYGPVTRTVVALRADEVILRTTIAPLAFSPDGSYMVYSARKGSDAPRLYLRPMDRLEAVELPGTEGGDNPFFSPDGQWLGFIVGGEMKKVAITGGPAVTLARVGERPRGASWGADARIIFGTYGQGLLRVSADGGALENLTPSDASPKTAVWPEILPGDEAVLFESGEAIVAQRLDTGERKVLLPGGIFPHFLPSGHLVYDQSGTLMAVPFDPERLEITGPPARLMEGVRSAGISRSGPQFAVSRTGTLAYVPGTVEGSASTLVWVDRQGRAEALPAPPRQYEYPALSPVDPRVAVGIVDNGETHVWMYDRHRDALTRLTLEGTWTTTPAWTRDGRWVAFNSDREGPNNVFRQRADGSGGMEQLRSSDYQNVPASFSPDGELLAFTETDPKTGRDIWILSLADGSAQAFRATRYEESAPQFSPDGEWLAYSSDESGRREVYVQPYPGPGGKWQVSTDGGQEPRWNPGGGELFYRSGSSTVSVPIDFESGFSAGAPRVLFEGPYLPTGFSYPNYDVSRDGQRFLMLAPVASASQPEGATHINVVFNWTEELKELVHSDR